VSLIVPIIFRFRVARYEERWSLCGEYKNKWTIYRAALEIKKKNKRSDNPAITQLETSLRKVTGYRLGASGSNRVGIFCFPATVSGRVVGQSSCYTTALGILQGLCPLVSIPAHGNVSFYVFVCIRKTALISKP
jgi:hypothetical protein